MAAATTGIEELRVRFQLKLQPQLFGQLGQVLQRLFRFLLLFGLVAGQLFKFDAAVAVDFAAFQAVRLDLLDDKRPRHIEEVGRLLCRQLVLLRHQQQAKSAKSGSDSN